MSRVRACVTLRVETPAKLTSELDGLRVITSNRHEFIFRVPESLVNIFSIGCTTVGYVCKVSGCRV